MPSLSPVEDDDCSVSSGAVKALSDLLRYCGDNVPEEIQKAGKVDFIAAPGSDIAYFPTPLREQEAMMAIKALEGLAAAAIANIRDGNLEPESWERRQIRVDVDKTSCFLMSAYLTTIDGMGKQDVGIKDKVPDTDLNRAQSILYRRLSAGMYRTKDGKFYHIHGSLDASTTLEMIDLPAFDSSPEMEDYDNCIKIIQGAVGQFTSEKLDEMNEDKGQAGIFVLTESEFRETMHGNTLWNMPTLSVQKVTKAKGDKKKLPRVKFPKLDNSSRPRSVLSGIKVLELCRVIAGPTIGRSLAAHGASVLKVTSPVLPDVPFFQVDVNTGKHTVALDLKNEADKVTFERLLEEADVIIDGYRPGAVDGLLGAPDGLPGCGKAKLLEIAAKRNKGFVYVAEDCFGGSRETGTDLPVPGAEWAHRAGWQQIADCVTGVAWAQGEFMGRNEPVVPPFPMSDYGTGALGCVAAMIGLYRREKEGGSYFCRTSLVQYDIFLQKLGKLSESEQQRLREQHAGDFFKLQYYDSVDRVGARALRSMRKAVPQLFTGRLMEKARSSGFNGEVAWPKEAIHVEGLRIGHIRASRPNGFDQPTWGGWEEDPNLQEVLMEGWEEARGQVKATWPPTLETGNGMVVPRRMRLNC